MSHNLGCWTREFYIYSVSPFRKGGLRGFRFFPSEMLPDLF